MCSAHVELPSNSGWHVELCLQGSPASLHAVCLLSSISFQRNEHQPRIFISPQLQNSALCFSLPCCCVFLCRRLPCWPSCGEIGTLSSHPLACACLLSQTHATSETLNYPQTSIPCASAHLSGSWSCCHMLSHHAFGTVSSHFHHHSSCFMLPALSPSSLTRPWHVPHCRLYACQLFCLFSRSHPRKVSPL